jgi:hypothetical protein
MQGNTMQQHHQPCHLTSAVFNVTPLGISWWPYWSYRKINMRLMQNFRVPMKIKWIRCSISCPRLELHVTNSTVQPLREKTHFMCFNELNNKFHGTESFLTSWFRSDGLEIHRPYGTWRFVTVFTKSTPLVPILSSWIWAISLHPVSLRQVQY